MTIRDHEYDAGEVTIIHDEEWEEEIQIEEGHSFRDRLANMADVLSGLGSIAFHTGRAGILAVGSEIKLRFFNREGN